MNYQVPTHPYEGQQWKEIRHDNTVTWLAFWKVKKSASEFFFVREEEKRAEENKKDEKKLTSKLFF